MERRPSPHLARQGESNAVRTAGGSMSGMSRPTKKLGSWLRRHSLTLVAALGGAAGVAYAAGWHSPSTARATVVEIQPSAAPVPEPVRDEVQDTVQIVLILDTSSSMDGLIN